MSGNRICSPADTEHRTNRVLSVPNALCAVRLLGSIVLVMLALMGYPRAFLWLFVVLAATDWIDGKLAILLNQRTVLGARLDSWADAALYASVGTGALWLHWETLSAELAWIAPAVLSYGVATGAGFWKFGKWPSYHTRAAKISWLIVSIGIICVLGEWSLWPLRVAMVAVTVTNIESLLLTYVLPEWRSDISSIVTIRRRTFKAESEDTTTTKSEGRMSS